MGESIYAWSRTAADNDDADASINWAEGMAPGAVNNSARSMMATLAKFRDDINGSLTSAGTSTAYTLTVNTAWAALATGDVFTFKASVSSGASPTLTVTDGAATALPAKKFRVFEDGTERDVRPNEILIGHRYHCFYDSTANAAAGAYIVLNPSIETVGYSSKTAAYTVVAADRGDIIEYSSGTADITFSLTAAATLGNGWYTRVRNATAYSVTLDPNGSETINGSATIALTSGQSALIQCDGSNFHAVVYPSVVAGGPTLLADTTISNPFTTVVDFTLNDGYTYYFLQWENVTFSVDSFLIFRFSTDGGATFVSAVNSYSYRNESAGISTPTHIASSGLNAAMVSGSLHIFGARDAAIKSNVVGVFGGGIRGGDFNGNRNTAEDNNAFRVTTTGANIASGRFRLWGYP